MKVGDFVKRKVDHLHHGGWFIRCTNKGKDPSSKYQVDQVTDRGEILVKISEMDKYLGHSFRFELVPTPLKPFEEWL